jgi:ABC-2 type transport system ATP-binding protein
MTVNQCLDLSAEIYFVTGNLKLQRIQELAHSFQIEHLLKRRVRTLSLGERMRCEVVTALLHRPKILLADEPTIGLDVIAKHQLRSTLLQWQKNENTTLMLTSHDLSDVEALCSRCILINHGKKIYDGPLQDLKGPLKAIRKIKIITEDSTESIELQINLETESLPATISRLAEQYKDSLLDITISEVSLEEVLTLTYGQTT